MASKREKLLESAQKHIRKNAWDKAIKDYQGVLEEDPGDVRTRLKVADLLVKIERFEEALAEYQTVAYHYAKDDIYDKAVAVYKQALRIAPEDPRLHRDLGEAYWRHGRLKDALRAFHMAQRHFREAGDGVSQRDVLERMVNIDPDDVGLHIQLAERYEKDGLRVEAIQIFRRCSGKLREEGRLDEFVQVAERVVFLEPADTSLRKEIIRIYLDREDNKHALKHLQILFKELPQDVEVLDALGMCFNRLGERDKAVLVYSELAKTQKRAGDERNALETYRKILGIHPNNAEAKTALGQNEKPQQQAAAAPVAKPAPAKDVLSSVEFLDDDSDVDVDPTPTNETEGGFLDLADEFDDFDSEVLSKFDENPATALGQRNAPAAAQPPVIPIVAELEPVAPKRSGVAELLAECEVFFKYKLHDRAQDVLGRAQHLEPENVEVREKLHQLYVEMGNTMRAAYELFEMARLTANSPARCKEYLIRARGFADETTVQRYAERYNVVLPAGMSPATIEEISEGIDEISETIGGNVGGEEPMLEFLPPDDEGDGVLNLDDLDIGDDILGAMDDSVVDDVEELEIDDFDGIAFDDDAMEILDDADDLLAVDDDMFLELFGDEPSAPKPVAKPTATRLPDVDLLIDAGEFSEAEAALNALEATMPNNPGIAARRARIQELRGHVNHSFGARSLSGRFAMEYSSAEVTTSLTDVHNTNLELGLTYVDMGLFEDALDEFEQALDDPQAKADALYYMAICDAELKNIDSASKRLSSLVSDASIPARVQEAAKAKLAELRAAVRG